MQQNKKPNLPKVRCTSVDLHCENGMFKAGGLYSCFGKPGDPSIVLLDEMGHERVVCTDKMRFLVRNSADPIRGVYHSKETPTGFAHFEFCNDNDGDAA